MIESPPTSLTLLNRLSDGDTSSWHRMFELYAPLLWVWLRPRGFQSADIDDLIQLALAVIHRRLPDFQYNGRPGAFRTWLRSIVTNVLRDHLRASRRRPTDHLALLAEIADPASELNARWDADHDRYVLRGLMAAVEPEFTSATWDAFRQTALDGQSTEEAAASLGLTPNAVRVARCRILARLRREAEGILDPF